jgi:hemoglobin/transferrin/lactoferrin receptor protein
MDCGQRRLMNTELGYKMQTQTTAIASMALYYMHLSNIINQYTGWLVNKVGGYNVYIKENNQESFIKGFEYRFPILH